MKNKKEIFQKNTLTYFILILSLLSSVNNCFAQWKTAAANNIKNDIVITYEVIYDRELSVAEKDSPEYLSEITVAFNKDFMVERRFGDKPKPINTYSLFDYNTLKAYSCSVLGSAKKAIKYDYKDPVTSVESPENTETKTILEFPCQKGLTLINNVQKEIYYTKNIGLKYCSRFKVDGFLLEYPGYSKTLGYYTVRGKKIIHDNLPSSFYSMADFDIKTIEEAKKTASESQTKFNELRMEFIGKKAKTFKDITIKQDKIDTKKIVGEIIVYNFWFTTCGPCKAEIPKLNKLKEKYKGKNVHFIAVALDPEYTIIPFLTKTPFSYDIIADGRWITEMFDVTAYPTNIIVDQKGTIQFYEIGFKSDISERMINTIDKYLEL